jgi:rhamnulokinase
LAKNIPVAAVDLGAESGRVLLIRFDGTHFEQHELHRFPNTPHTVEGRLSWNWSALQGEISKGLALAAPHSPVSVGVDTWGVDQALLDEAGNLLLEPIHYRDVGRNSPQNAASLIEKTPLDEIFRATGIQNMTINTLYLFHWYAQHMPELLERAATSLYMPDLINFWLSGVRVNEYTNATTSQMLNPATGRYATQLLDKLNIPTHIFPEVVQPGSTLGAITLDHPLKGVTLIAPATHDTGSAVAAIPAADADYAYISSGTWSLFGLESPRAVMDERAQAANVTNEGGVAGTIRLLKNIIGLWLIQESRRAWSAAGQDYTHAQLAEMAAAAPPFTALIDPNAPEFLPPGDMPARIQNYCGRTGQPVPESVGAISRCIFESLALKYRYVLEELIDLTGQTVNAIHIIGGGSNNKLLCQMTANATGREVVAGPAEATALGNALVQLIALGEIGSIAEGRALIRASITPERYHPQSDGWDAAYDRFLKLTQQENA